MRLDGFLKQNRSPIQEINPLPIPCGKVDLLSQDLLTFKIDDFDLNEYFVQSMDRMIAYSFAHDEVIQDENLAHCPSLSISSRIYIDIDKYINKRDHIYATYDGVNSQIKMIRGVIHS